MEKLEIIESNHYTGIITATEGARWDIQLGEPEYNGRHRLTEEEAIVAEQPTEEIEPVTQPIEAQPSADLVLASDAKKYDKDPFHADPLAVQRAKMTVLHREDGRTYVYTDASKTGPRHSLDKRAYKAAKRQELAYQNGESDNNPSRTRRVGKIAIKAAAAATALAAAANYFHPVVETVQEKVAAAYAAYKGEMPSAVKTDNPIRPMAHVEAPAVAANQVAPAPEKAPAASAVAPTPVKIPEKTPEKAPETPVPAIKPAAPNVAPTALKPEALNPTPYPVGTAKYYAHLAGFRGKSVDTIAEIGVAESQGNAKAHNGNAKSGDNSYGWLQMNMLGSMGPARRKQWGIKSNEELFDPLKNAKAAYQLSNHGKNFSPWTTFTKKIYRRHAGANPVISDGAPRKKR